MVPTVICTYFDGSSFLPDYSGGVYDWSWVQKLYNGVKNNSTIPFRFVCLSDQPPGDISPEIEVVPFLEPPTSWLCINEVYRPDLGIERGVFMGLDTVILGNITPILEWDGGFGVTRSPYFPNTLCNAVVSFSPRWAGYLWRMWVKRKNKWIGQCSDPNFALGHPSEVVFLRLNKNEEWEFLDDYFPNQICSWKTRGISEDTRILYFHGNPKPHQLLDEPVIQEAWS